MGSTCRRPLRQLVDFPSSCQKASTPDAEWVPSAISTTSSRRSRRPPSPACSNSSNKPSGSTAWPSQRHDRAASCRVLRVRELRRSRTAVRLLRHGPRDPAEHGAARVVLSHWCVLCGSCFGELGRCGGQAGSPSHGVRYRTPHLGRGRPFLISPLLVFYVAVLVFCGPRRFQDRGCGTSVIERPYSGLCRRPPTPLNVPVAHLKPS